MVGRIQYDGTFATVNPATGTTSRADLTVSTAPVGSEMPERAITGATKDQHVPPEMQGHVAVLGGIRRAMDGLHRSEIDDRRLAELAAKLVLGGERLKAKGDVDPAMLKEIEETLSAVEDFGRQRAETADDRAKPPPLLGAEPAEDPIEPARKKAEPRNVPDVTASKAQVLRRIHDALNRIGTLRTKVQGDREGQYEQLLTLNSSISGLNFARTRLADTDFSIATAAETVDHILVGIKTAVVAHGRVSPDLVRLVL
jgi:hypothetical protein